MHVQWDVREALICYDLNSLPTSKPGDYVTGDSLDCMLKGLIICLQQSSRDTGSSKEYRLNQLVTDSVKKPSHTWGQYSGAMLIIQ